MESENASPQRGRFAERQAEELARDNAEEAADAAAEAAPAPTGGKSMYAASYYFTIKENGVEVTLVRDVILPGDAIVVCQGNTLVISHEGVADTFRIGRVRPVELT